MTFLLRYCISRQNWNIKTKLKECILRKNWSVQIRVNVFHLKLQKFFSYESWSSYKGWKRWKTDPSVKSPNIFKVEGIKLTSTVIKLILFEFLLLFFVIFFLRTTKFYLEKKLEKKSKIFLQCVLRSSFNLEYRIGHLISKKTKFFQRRMNLGNKSDATLLEIQPH